MTSPSDVQRSVQLPAKRHDLPWFIASLVLIIVVALGLRIGTHIQCRPFTFDERYITAPINDIISQGWTTRTAIDFKETKGPALIWPYAALGQIIGGDLNSLRLISVGFFILGAVPVLVIARWCGIAGPRLLLVALFYGLLPYHAVLGQLVMSEPSFILGSAALMLIFVWGFGQSPTREHRVAGPVLVAIVLSVLLHNRIHAAAFAGAMCLTAFERDRFRSWPWWLACALAALSRIPLWIRWGGLVHPDYAQMHSLGVRLDSLAYIAAGFVPFTILFLWPAVLPKAGQETTSPRWRMFIGSGAVAGLLLGLAARPALNDQLQVRFDDTSFEAPLFQGIAATFARTASASQGVQHGIIALMATLGLASLGALAALTWKRQITTPAGVVLRLLIWSLLCGWAMYALTSGYVFDRYLMGWAALLPIAWVLLLPRSAMALQAAALLAVLGYHARTYLM
jgi:hypothetical protein